MNEIRLEEGNGNFPKPVSAPALTLIITEQGDCIKFEIMDATQKVSPEAGAKLEIETVPIGQT